MKIRQLPTPSQSEIEERATIRTAMKEQKAQRKKERFRNPPGNIQIFTSEEKAYVIVNGQEVEHFVPRTLADQMSTFRSGGSQPAEHKDLNLINIKLVSGKNQPAPEKEFLRFDVLLFFAAFTCRREDREATLGDIEEKFEMNCKRFGKRGAKQIIAWDIFRSLLSITREVTRTRMVKILKSLGLHIVLRYFIG